MQYFLRAYVNGSTWTNAALETAKFIGRGKYTEQVWGFLQSLGKYVTANAIIDYLQQPEVMKRYSLQKVISEVTAERWMSQCGFRWTTKRFPSQMVYTRTEDAKVVSNWGGTSGGVFSSDGYTESHSSHLVP